MATYEISLTKRKKRGIIRQAVASTDYYLGIAEILREVLDYDTSRVEAVLAQAILCTKYGKSLNMLHGEEAVDATLRKACQEYLDWWAKQDAERDKGFPERIV